MVDRVSSNLIFSIMGRSVIRSQNEVFELAKQLDSGKKFNSPQDDPIAIIGAITTEGRILDNSTDIRNYKTATLDLESQEVALTTINDILDRIHEIAVKSGSDGASADERLIYKNMIGLLNSKSGDKYIFSGQQTEIQTLRLDPGASFSSIMYKNGQDNGSQRQLGNLKTSIDVKDTFISNARGARLNNSVINPVSTLNGNLDFEVNDGNGVITSFTANILAGDNLSTIIGKINTAFNGAGGLGSVAQESPAGYLKMDTALVTGNVATGTSRISVKSTSNLSLTNELGINRQDNYGIDQGLFKTLSDLETYLSSNNPTAIRGLLDKLKFNSKQLNTNIGNLGLLTAQADRFTKASEDMDIKLQDDLSRQQDLDVVDASLRYSNAQVALQTAVRTASSFFSQSMADFIT
jgi:flagellar hook-associated protein 3 FlgL